MREAFWIRLSKSLAHRVRSYGKLGAITWRRNRVTHGPRRKPRGADQPLHAAVPKLFAEWREHDNFPWHPYA